MNDAECPAPARGGAKFENRAGAVHTSLPSGSIDVASTVLHESRYWILPVGRTSEKGMQHVERPGSAASGELKNFAAIARRIAPLNGRAVNVPFRVHDHWSHRLRQALL